MTGQIKTSDGGSLSYPESDQAGFPEAAIYTRISGSIDQNNPLGDQNASALDGSFSVSYLPAGTYDITIESLGYRPMTLPGVVITNASTHLGTLTLQKGPTLLATLASPTARASIRPAWEPPWRSPRIWRAFIFGQISSDANTGNITSIRFSGFELTPKIYSVLLFDNQNNIIAPPEGQSLTFTSNSDSIVKALTYQPSQPFCDRAFIAVGLQHEHQLLLQPAAAQPRR